MAIALSKDVESMINYRVKSGLYESADELILQALVLLDRQNAQKLYIEKALEEGEESMANGAYCTPEQLSDSMDAIIKLYKK
jgi:putative addiction module CopG family antidote